MGPSTCFRDYFLTVRFHVTISRPSVPPWALSSKGKERTPYVNISFACATCANQHKGL